MIGCMYRWHQCATVIDPRLNLPGIAQAQVCEPPRGSRSLWCALGLARLEAVQHPYDTGRPHASFGHITRPRTPTTKPRTRPGPARRPLPGPPRTGPPTIATTNPTSHQHTRLTRLVDTCGDNDHRRVPLIGSATERLLRPWLNDS